MSSEMPMKYLNYPIQLHQDVFSNSPYVFARNVILYGAFYHVFSPKATFDDVDDFLESFDFALEEFEMGPKEVEDLGMEIYVYCHERKKNPPMAGISIDKLRSLFEKEWDPFRLICLLMYLAMRSILQKGPVQFNCTQEYIFSRIAGFSQSKEIVDLPKEVQYWATPYRMRKCIKFLEENYGLLLPHGNRKGYTYSFKTIRDKDERLMTREKLEWYNQFRKKKYQYKALEKEKKKAFEQVKAKMASF